MKRRIFSMAFVLLLLLLSLPAAYAETYSAPDSVEAGEALHYLAARVPAESQVSADEKTLPDGVALALKETVSGTETLLDVYLEGVPESAGTYDCRINVLSGESSNHLVVSLSVLPGTPMVTASQAVSCFLGDAVTVSVEASVGDGGSLSYQWYYNGALNTTTGSPIEGATEPVYRPDTSNPGTSYYYCVVTNVNGEQSVSVASDIIPVSVSELSISAITIETLPSRTMYTVGEMLDTSGLSIRARYSNNASVVVTEGFDVSPRHLDTEGVKTIEVWYQGLVCSFTVAVDPPEELLEGIGVNTLPDKKDYTVGDTLDTRGLSIRLYTSLDKTGKQVVYAEELECSPTVLEKAGEQTVTVSYGGKTCTFTLNVQEEEKPERLILGTLPDKIQYTVGDTLDTTGLTVVLITNRNNRQEIRSGFVCSPTLLDAAGTRQITVSYENMSCTFNVTVSSRTPESTVVPTPTVQPPVTPPPSGQTVVPPSTPAPTPHIVEHQAHGTRAGNLLQTVVILLAVLALLGLGILVFVMKRGGLEQVNADLEAWIQRIKERFGEK